MTLQHIGMAIGDWQRTVAKEAQIPLINRYFEQDPVPLDGEAALLARPALRKWLTVGAGPIRGMCSQLGMFGDALFIVSQNTLYKVNTDETITTIGSGLAGTTAYIPMCITDSYLWLADGTNLWYYTNNGFATGTLTVTGTISANETVTLGTTVYKFVAAGGVDAGTPAGTSTNPWLVSLGADTSHALTNLGNAITGNGTAGTDYSTLLTAHTSVTTSLVTSTTVKVTAITAGTSGNSIATTETLANGSFGGTTLSGGGATSFTTAVMPNNEGVVWVDTIDRYVIAVVAQGYNENGRFYYIMPGQNTVDPLNFATAERAPDPIYSVMTLGDQFWLFGSSTTEIWYPTGDATAPFERIQGRLFDRGIWGGTAVKIGDQMMVVDRNSVAWLVGDQGVQRVSNNGVEQRIRESQALELRG
jgi:hypothetical protein